MTSNDEPHNATDQLVEKLLVGPAKRLLGSAATGIPPQAAMRTMVGDAQNAGGTVDTESAAAMLSDVLQRMVQEGFNTSSIATTPAQAVVDADVFAIFDRLEASFPLGTIAVISLHSGLGHTSWAERSYQSMQLGHELLAVQGERRGLKLKEFAWWMLEYEYGPFVHLLNELGGACRGDRYEAFRSIGRTIRRARVNGVLGTELWDDAAHVRNAASHNGGWRVDIDRNLILLRDVHPNGTVWTLDVDIDVLAKRIDQCAGVAGAIMSAFQRALHRDFLPLWAPAFADWTRTKDENLLEAATAPIQLRLEGSWTALQNLGWPAAPRT